MLQAENLKSDLFVSHLLEQKINKIPYQNRRVLIQNHKSQFWLKIFSLSKENLPRNLYIYLYIYNIYIYKLAKLPLKVLKYTVLLLHSLAIQTALLHMFQRNIILDKCVLWQWVMQENAKNLMLFPKLAGVQKAPVHNLCIKFTMVRHEKVSW